jgi:radical SAM superfamily enzyme YgiQ (UPF0313 family)
MRLTLVHPAIGRRAGERYLRSWEMEPLPAATVAGLTPKDVEVRFYDDRLEPVPYDEPTDLVALSVETYTARRAYQIASEYRRRGVPVVMGGFHATLKPEEVARWAEAVVVGEAEELWPRLVDDFRHGRLEEVYRQSGRPSLAAPAPDRSIFRGKRYLPVALVETGRGCRFRCDFCAVQTVFAASRTRRPLDALLRELEEVRRRAKLIFFVDDNICSDLAEAKELFRALRPLGIRWVSQASLHAAQDDELLELMAESGCRGVLIGFESLDPVTLAAMNKRFNTAGGGYETALANLRRHHIRIYGTFVFGYEADGPESILDSVEFACRHRLYIAAFNHLTPFPGTPLYQRLEAQGRLLYDAWWLDSRYRYNQIPFRPRSLSPEELERGCVGARKAFYSWRSIFQRGLDGVNRSDRFMFRNFFPINAMLRGDTARRHHFPLGDPAWHGPWLPAR